MARPIKATNNNVNVFQSYILTTAKYKFSVYEKRIIYRLVEAAQSEINEQTNGEPLKYHLRPLGSTMFGDKDFMMNISCILDVCGEDATNTNYERVKQAFRKLMEKRIEWEDKKENSWSCVPLLGRVTIRKGEGSANFTVSREFWNMIMNMAKGFRKYELLTAMKLKSPYSMRLYEIMAGQKEPFTIPIDDMRKMFCLENKYTRPASIIERIIEPAKKELDECAPYSFSLKIERSGKGGKTSPITGFTFIPYRIEDNQDKELQRAERASKLTGRNFLNQDAFVLLTKVFGWNITTINKNKITIKKGEETIPDFSLFLLSIKEQKGYTEAHEKGNPIGYVINSIKNKINELAGGKNASRTRHTNRSETAIQKEDMNYDDTETW